MALSNAGQRLERMKADGVGADVLRRNQSEVLRQAAQFVADLIGNAACFDPEMSEHPGELVSSFLATLRPLFPSPPTPLGVIWSELISELARLPYGDEPSMLKPSPRLRGQPSQPGQIAFRRMRALEWAEYFKGRGFRPKFFQPAIALAFGSEWDAIRHWPTSIRAVIGSDGFANGIRFAAEGYFIQRPEKPIMENLYIDGCTYRIFAGIAELEWGSFHRKWEEIARSLSVHESVLED